MLNSVSEFRGGPNTYNSKKEKEKKKKDTQDSSNKTEQLTSGKPFPPLGVCRRLPAASSGSRSPPAAACPAHCAAGNVRGPRTHEAGAQGHSGAKGAAEGQRSGPSSAAGCVRLWYVQKFRAVSPIVHPCCAPNLQADLRASATPPPTVSPHLCPSGPLV